MANVYWAHYELHQVPAPNDMNMPWNLWPTAVLSWVLEKGHPPGVLGKQEPPWDVEKVYFLNMFEQVSHFAGESKQSWDLYLRSPSLYLLERYVAAWWHRPSISHLVVHLCDLQHSLRSFMEILYNISILWLELTCSVIITLLEASTTVLDSGFRSCVQLHSRWSGF